MSVIMNAMEAAKRERARRESQGVPPGVGRVLVPLRAPARSGLDVRKLAVFAATAAVVIVAGAAAAMLRPRSEALPTVPPLTSTILAEALAADTARPARPTPPIRVPQATEPSRGAASVSPAPTSSVATRGASAPAPAAQDTVAIPQGEARAVDVAPPVESETRPSGRLRVAMERSSRPESARLFAEAVAAHRAGDVPTARKLYESLLVVSPNDADALNNLGVLLSAQREYTQALGLLRRASVIAPRNAGVWNNIGTVFREQGKNSDAIAAFRQALTLDPQHAGAKVGLAQQYMAISSLAQARQLLEEVSAVHPQLPEAHYTLGQVLELQGDRAGAIKAYSAFINTAPVRLANHVELVRRRVDVLSRP